MLSPLDSELRRFARILEMLFPYIQPDWVILTSNSLYISIALALLLGTSGTVIALINNLDIKLKAEKDYGFLVESNKLEIIYNQCCKNGYSSMSPYDAIIGIFSKEIISQLKGGGYFYNHTNLYKKKGDDYVESIPI